MQTKSKTVWLLRFRLSVKIDLIENKRNFLILFPSCFRFQTPTKHRNTGYASLCIHISMSRAYSCRLIILDKCNLPFVSFMLAPCRSFHIRWLIRKLGARINAFFFNQTFLLDFKVIVDANKSL